MNRANLKRYAPRARRQFRQAIADKAARLGLSEAGIVPLQVIGDYAIIGTQAFPKAIADQRGRVEKWIEREGFEAVVDEIAYTWFNRFMAIRFMELHSYLEHGFQVLGHPDGKLSPQILEEAEHVALEGVDPQLVTQLKLDGTRDEELYRILLLAQCRALHRAMPFLFEPINDETELLLPDTLLVSDSIIRTLVSEIPASDWEQIEIIGWLYQFYISEKKDEVIGKVVKSEDIPAATQLFTPNWIVKYMTQNSLGRQWLATYPDSPLRETMEYYIEPAQQTPEVKAQLAALTPDALDVETLTLLDPACGSGHILVEAYDLLRAMYLERGYRPRDAARLILEKNLFGLDIDPRAAQMAGFAVLMKARADDRRLLDDPQNPPRLNVRALENGEGLDARALAPLLTTSQWEEIFPTLELFPELRAQPTLTVATEPHLGRDIAALLELFRGAKTFGSLLTVPLTLAARLPQLRALLETKRGQSLLENAAVEELEPLVAQAEILAGSYDCVVMNPPYMGSKGMNADLKTFANTYFPLSKADLFAMFIERGLAFSTPNGFCAMITMQSWMFLSSYEHLRTWLLEQKMLVTMAHLGARSFAEIGGEVVQTTAFVIRNTPLPKFKSVFFRALEGGETEKAQVLRESLNRFDDVEQSEFEKIPGSPIAYWLSKNLIDSFDKANCINLMTEPKSGLSTTDNERFLRYWHEVSQNNIGFFTSNILQTVAGSATWYPFHKGGEFRRWYGNSEFVVNWYDNGREIKEKTKGAAGGRIVSPEFYFQKGITWSGISSGKPSMRLMESSIFGSGGKAIFPKENFHTLFGFLNSEITLKLLEVISPTLNYEAGHIGKLPFPNIGDREKAVTEVVEEAISISRMDWDSFETSWDFGSSPFLSSESLEAAFGHWQNETQGRRERLRVLETENNRLFIAAYGLEGELSPDVPDAQITLARADREADMRRLLSYAIGCMMGRYSLDGSGLIYAYAGGEGFEPERYHTFPADADGILPITDAPFFEDDIAERVKAWLRAAYGNDNLELNGSFLAESLGTKAGESWEETIRRYFVADFYRSHLQTYKNRPIYWLFSSGKEKAFGAIVYLHRYNAGTLSRMRNDYVLPLQGRLQSRMTQLASDAKELSTPAARRLAEKELQKRGKQLVELQLFDEKLRHLADARIELDLDDGVRVNYAKFGSLLSETKLVTGGSAE